MTGQADNIIISCYCCYKFAFGNHNMNLTLLLSILELLWIKWCLRFVIHILKYLQVVSQTQFRSWTTKRYLLPWHMSWFVHSFSAPHNICMPYWNVLASVCSRWLVLCLCQNAALVVKSDFIPSPYLDNMNFVKREI